MTVDPAFPMLALLLLAAVFAAAALAKAKDLEVFQGVVEQYRLLPQPLVAPFAYALPVVELLGALGLLLPATRPAAALLLILLLVAFAAAMAINLVRGRNDSTLRWEEAFLDGLVTSALLRYLAIAHWGRGRGRWTQGEYAPFWRDLVVQSVVENQDRLAAIWSRRGEGEDAVQRELEELLERMALGLLDRLYPGALDRE